MSDSSHRQKINTDGGIALLGRTSATAAWSRRSVHGKRNTVRKPSSYFQDSTILGVLIGLQTLLLLLTSPVQRANVLYFLCAQLGAEHQTRGSRCSRTYGSPLAEPVPRRWHGVKHPGIRQGLQVLAQRQGMFIDITIHHFARTHEPETDVFALFA